MQIFTILCILILIYMYGNGLYILLVEAAVLPFFAVVLL